jgi:hypothetical protein
MAAGFVVESFARARCAARKGLLMNLLVMFVAVLLVCQAISVGLGLLAERMISPYTGLVTFIACYFLMFWVAWRIAIRLTAPRSRTTT